MSIKKRYEDICNEYVDKFCEKQELYNNGWVEDQVGGIVECSYLPFNFQDIVWDINSNQPKRLIIDWYYESVDNPEKSINYYSYTKGLRIK